MGKVAPDNMIDMAFLWISGSANYYTVCSGSPATYTDARVTNCLAGIGITTGCFANSNDTSGRKMDITAKTSASITVSGSALAVCILNTTSSNLLYVTTCTEQYLVSGGTVDIPTWKINIQDPT
jgi:hypothetical protein